MEKVLLDLYNGVLYKPKGEIKCILQIIHGISEHMGRYEELAEFLCRYGVAVAGFDLLGHGVNKNESNIATFNRNGWYKTIEDIHRFNLHVQQLYHVPTFIMGFSLGSFLLREYVSLYDNVNLKGIIVVGTGYQPKMLLNMMISVMQTQINAVGFDQTTALVDKLLFENYNSKFSPSKTSFDWLCSDEDEIKKYMQDELCIKRISTGLFYQLLCSMKTTGYKRIYDQYNKDLPILLLSGKEDPVGDFSKAIKRIYKDLQDAGIKDTEMKILDYSRHDIFHEKRSGDYLKASQILIQWILKH